jgi:GDP-4-dehydro-6-deoxy-D-mannose reductase
LLPLSPYGVSKVGQDLLAYQYHKADQLKTLRARIFNTTGPRKVGDMASDFTRRAVEIEMGLSTQLRVGNLTTQRAITDVRDLVRALALLAAQGEPGEVYNISGSRVYGTNDVLQLVASEARVPIKVTVDPDLLRPTDEPLIFGDSSRLIACTGWKQEFSLQETIQDMMEYWRNHLGPNQ